MESQDQHLTENERNAYEKTIGKLQQARSLERVLLFLILVVMAVGALLVYNTNRNSQKRQTEVINSIKQEVNTVNRHLDCVVAFFTNPNRADLSIKDIENCTLRTEDGEEIFYPPTTENPEGGQTPSVMMNPSSSGSSTTPEPRPEPNPNPPTPGPETPERPIRRLLGIPVCVPLTDMCVRR